MRKLAAELLGTFVLVFAGTGAIVADDLTGGTVTHVGVALTFGLVVLAMIYAVGDVSGAHLNPAVTLTFLRLGRIRPWDALFFCLAQVAGGALGVFLVARLAGAAFTAPPVRYAATLPGELGPTAAFAAEFLISALLMLTVLVFSATPRLARLTGAAAGALVALYISLESPLSGMSMNPARSFASALPGGLWDHFWIYVTAPCFGMLCGAQLFLALRGARGTPCAKLVHPAGLRCIHCGHEPPPSTAMDSLRSLAS